MSKGLPKIDTTPDRQNDPIRLEFEPPRWLFNRLVLDAQKAGMPLKYYITAWMSKQIEKDL